VKSKGLRWTARGRVLGALLDRATAEALVAGALLGLTGIGAQAGVLYNDGPVSGELSAFFIGEVEDSFTLGSASTIGGVTFGSWLAQGDTATSVEWSIVGSEGSQVPVCAGCTGTASLSGTFLFENGGGWDIWDESFSIPSVALGAGTYWLELQDAVTANDSLASWDLNGGPSSVWTKGFGDVTGANCAALPYGFAAGACSNSFEILGTPGVTPVPESGALTLFGVGLVGVALSRRKFPR
jgi:hypothetical protein